MCCLGAFKGLSPISTSLREFVISFIGENGIAGCWSLGAEVWETIALEALMSRMASEDDEAARVGC
jgi:hypothetical protein